MSIVLNEYDWAERMLNNHDLGPKPVETLSRISRYYYENQYSKKEIRRLLDSFMLPVRPVRLTCPVVGHSGQADKECGQVSIDSAGRS